MALAQLSNPANPKSLRIEKKWIVYDSLNAFQHMLHDMLYDMLHGMLYDMLHGMLYDMLHDMLYEMLHDMKFEMFLGMLYHTWCLKKTQ